MATQKKYLTVLGEDLMTGDTITHIQSHRYPQYPDGWCHHLADPHQFCLQQIEWESHSEFGVTVCWGIKYPNDGGKEDSQTVRHHYWYSIKRIIEVQHDYMTRSKK